MKIWFSPYELIPRARLNARAASSARRGALIRVDSGFADLHPWPELGDAPLEEQLRILAGGGRTPLIDGARRCAAFDGEARERGVSLFAGLSIPSSHWPAVAGAPPLAFDTVKVKCGPATTPDHLREFEGKRLRLDFNGTLSAEEFEEFARVLEGIEVDFVEDPTPYDPDVWMRWRAATGIRLALDRGEGEAGVDVIVHKPALGRDVPLSSKPVVVTSYMDHPVGQFFAAFEAARNPSVSDRCGLFTHVVYEPTRFTEAVGAIGSRLVAPSGTGLGFDEQLSGVTWRPLL